MTPSAPPADLAQQIRATAEEWRLGAPLLAVRVTLTGTGPRLATCELWTGDAAGDWNRRAALPDGVGATMLNVESAAVLAGYAVDLTEEFSNGPRARWRHDANGNVYSLGITRPAYR